MLKREKKINIIKSGVCLFVCQHSYVQALSNPPVLELLAIAKGTYGILYDQDSGGDKTNWGNIQAKKILYIIPSASLSFLSYYCQSFQIFVLCSTLKPIG